MDSMKYSTSYMIKVKLDNGKSFNFESQSLNLEPVYFRAILDKIKNDIDKMLSKRNYFQWEIEEISIKVNNLEKVKKMPPEKLNEINFFHYLLRKTETIFQDSETKKKYPDSNWNFAICDTPIQKGKGVFFGLNWGGDNINQQTTYPGSYKERKWKFITSSRPLFREHFKQEIEELNYSNLCFFRSPNLKKLESSDWRLAIPLFEEYIKFINPPWCLMLGNPKPLQENNRISELKRHSITDPKTNKQVFGYTGILFDKYTFGSVPHTESRISSNARNEIWKKVTSIINL